MEYVLIAGPNGSGKTTLIKNLQSLDEYRDFVYISADEIENDIRKDTTKNLTTEQVSEQARKIAMELRSAYLVANKDIIYESVVSHPSHVEGLIRIKELGYDIKTIYVTTESAEINIKRVCNRGRDNDILLTKSKVEARYIRSMDLLSELIEHSDISYVFDNSTKYFMVFYKDGININILVNQTNWSDDYIVKKLEEKGFTVCRLENCGAEIACDIEKIEATLIRN